MEKILDLTLASEYDLVVERGRTLNSSITCTYIDSTGTTQYFSFSDYIGATLMVKNSAGSIIITFSTNDGSIELLTDGIFKLSKTDQQMLVPRVGTYQYDMYLTSPTYPKRAFLKGKITFEQNISN